MFDCLLSTVGHAAKARAGRQRHADRTVEPGLARCSQGRPPSPISRLGRRRQKKATSSEGQPVGVWAELGPNLNLARDRPNEGRCPPNWCVIFGEFWQPAKAGQAPAKFGATLADLGDRILPGY